MQFFLNDPFQKKVEDAGFFVFVFCFFFYTKSINANPKQPGTSWGARPETPGERRDGSPSPKESPSGVTPINQAAPDPPDEGSLLNACRAPKEPKTRIKGVTLLGRGERVWSTAALKVTMRRGGGGRRRDELWRGRGSSEKSCECRHEAPHSPIPRALGGDSWPDPAPRRKKPAHLYDLRVRARQETTCEGPPEHPHQLLPYPIAVRGAPKLSGPRRDNPTPAFHSASRAGDLPHRFYRGRTAIATHLAQQQEPFS